jgi:hypothetical protein
VPALLMGLMAIGWSVNDNFSWMNGTNYIPLYSKDQMRPAWHDWEQLRENIGSSETIAYTRAQGKKP